MFLFISFVAALFSLYYLGVMVDTYNADTTFLTPIIVLLIFSVLSIAREIRRKSISWLIDDDDYGCSKYNNGSYYNSNTVYRSNSYNSGYNYNSTQSKPTEKTEYFIPNEREKKDDSKEIIHYPSYSEVREKIKELEKSRWFRFKRDFAGVFAIDITSKYYKEYKKPYKINRRGKIIHIDEGKINKEDHSRFTPPSNSYLDREKAEYNAVTKLMRNRSCEIALTDEEAAVLEETNIQKDNDGKQ